MAIAPALGSRTRHDGRVLVLVGAVCGLAWAAAMRGFMAEAAVTAGLGSTFSWIGTFVVVLPAGAIVGALLGRAEHRRRTGVPRGRLRLAPLILAIEPGALLIVLPAMAGGWVIAGNGSRRQRWAAGVAAVLPVPAYVTGLVLLGDLRILATARGLWTTVLLFSLLAVLTLACAVPHRASAGVAGANGDIGTDLHAEARTGRDGRTSVLVGAVCGLAWAAAMRGFMAEFALVAGPESTFSWIGTFVVILPAGAIVGALLGRAGHLRRTDGLRRRNRFRFAPLIFAIDPASLVVVAPAMAGGWVIAGKGSRRRRWAAGAAAVLPVPVYLTLVYVLDDIRTLATPRGLWTAILLFSLLAVLTQACAVPHRTSTYPPQS